jgi:hypothetical protein
MSALPRIISVDDHVIKPWTYGRIDCPPSTTTGHRGSSEGAARRPIPCQTRWSCKKVTARVHAGATSGYTKTFSGRCMRDMCRSGCTTPAWMPMSRSPLKNSRLAATSSVGRTEFRPSARSRCGVMTFARCADRRRHRDHRLPHTYSERGVDVWLPLRT